MLSSLYYDQEKDQESGVKNKPTVITFYNKTKSGVDNVDKLIHCYDVSRNYRRWPLTLFFWMLYTAGINPQIIQTLNSTENQTNRKSFIKELGLALIDSHLQSRKDNNRLSMNLRKRIASHMNIEEGPRCM